MLRQSVIDSDLSYEDMMENRKLKDLYGLKVKDVLKDSEGIDCIVSTIQFDAPIPAYF